MIYTQLGKTGIEVSKIAFGSLTMGPLQRNMSAEEGAFLIEYAFHEKGINFLDTAELYETYPHVALALKNIPRKAYRIASKSYAYSRETAKRSFETALEALQTDYLDLFMLHEQVDEWTFRGHYEAVDYFMEMKEKGVLKSFGISTHYISGVRAAIKFPEIDVVHPIVNKKGLGILDGGIDEMAQALMTYKARGGGVFGMKPLGGGNLLNSIDENFEFVLSRPYLDAIAFGMQSTDEIDYNVAKIMGDPIDEQLKRRLKGRNKSLQIADWCIKCGACVEKCDHKALSLTEAGIVIDHSKCVLCGYCASVCPEFCIKVY
ncbi:aldo/keto reductase [Fusibacter tunisiensis]|uniref:Aldo/keto reductase-like oxidoreductase n=1 Tax=Fusibacter tunisiensis TaxID=1008308 RepID=A0ABS2MQC5_9FIRM|nr:aldo/keto reductase [Fusibacter tunisiensis]MBM7561582.1 putative aldo/keto reductase-like oxidoreductase [Fusibacter tunisiensis]